MQGPPYNSGSVSYHAPSPDKQVGRLPDSGRGRKTVRQDIVPLGHSTQEHSMHTAGVKNRYSLRSAPYCQGNEPPTRLERNTSAAWTYKYERPQYARKTCSDLMVTGPNIRTELPSRGHAIKRQGFYAYEASVGSTTTYQQNSGSKM